MTQYDDLTFVDLRDRFISGFYKYDSDECVDAGGALHDKLPAVEELVPLLQADDRVCQATATYIAAQEGEKACSIFPYVFELIESPWAEVRSEVCDCFISSAPRAKHFVKLFGLIGDPEESVRLKVIQVLYCLTDDQLFSIYEYISDKVNVKCFAQAMSILIDQRNHGVSYGAVKNGILDKSRIVKIFSYVAAIREFDNDLELLSLVKLSNDMDIQRYHDIFLR